MKQPLKIHPSLLIAALTLLLTGCKDSGNAEVAGTDLPEAGNGGIFITNAQFSGAGMELEPLGKRSFSERLRVSGVLDVPPENRAAVSAISGGFVRKITLLVGDAVREGQLIVSLENPEFLQLQQQYLEAREQIPYLEAEFNRQKTLYEEKISSEKSYLQAESEYRTTLARSRGLGRQLELLNIPIQEIEAGNLTSLSPVYAPISGSITSVNVSNGSYVSPATVIAEIIDHAHLHLELQVYEKDITRLRKGQLIQFTLPELSNTTYQARVYLIGTSIDQNRTVKVHAHLIDEEHPEFLVGMFVRAEIDLETETGTDTNIEEELAVPESAIVREGQEAYIYILGNQSPDGYEFKRIPVTTGSSSGGYVAVQVDEQIGSSQVLVSGAVNLKGL